MISVLSVDHSGWSLIPEDVCVGLQKALGWFSEFNRLEKVFWLGEGFVLPKRFWLEFEKKASSISERAELANGLPPKYRF